MADPRVTLACNYCGAPAGERCTTTCPAPDDGEGGRHDQQQRDSGGAHAPTVAGLGRSGQVTQ